MPGRVAVRGDVIAEYLADNSPARARRSGTCSARGPVYATWIRPKIFFKSQDIFRCPSLYLIATTVAAPVLERQLGPVRVEGRVVEIDALPEGYRNVVVPRSVEQLDAARLPQCLRIKVTRGGDDLLPGRSSPTPFRDVPGLRSPSHH